MPVFRFSYGMRSTHVAHACDVCVIHVDREEKKSALLICELNKSIWIVVGAQEHVNVIPFKDMLLPMSTLIVHMQPRIFTISRSEF